MTVGIILFVLFVVAAWWLFIRDRKDDSVAMVEEAAPTVAPTLVTEPVSVTFTEPTPAAITPIPVVVKVVAPVEAVVEAKPVVAKKPRVAAKKSAAPKVAKAKPAAIKPAAKPAAKPAVAAKKPKIRIAK